MCVYKVQEPGFKKQRVSTKNMQTPFPTHKLFTKEECAVTHFSLNLFCSILSDANILKCTTHCGLCISHCCAGKDNGKTCPITFILLCFGFVRQSCTPHVTLRTTAVNHEYYHFLILGHKFPANVLLIPTLCKV